jgi:phosphoenolpyruvate carboxylase
MNGKYCCGFQAYYSEWATATFFFFRSYLQLYPCKIMETKKSRCTYITRYLQEQNHSSDEEQEVESFEFDDFEPLMDSFRRLRGDLSETEKQSLMARGLIALRRNQYMPFIMSKTFDFDMETSDIEKDLFSVKEKMEPIFNFIDLSFQLLDGPVDDKVPSLIRKLTELRRYYDRKSTLNMNHSETIIDLFRVCAKKYKVLSRVLGR